MDERPSRHPQLSVTVDNTNGSQTQERDITESNEELRKTKKLDSIHSANFKIDDILIQEQDYIPSSNRGGPSNIVNTLSESEIAVNSPNYT
jgi:hypothetical protein